MSAGLERFHCIYIQYIRRVEHAQQEGVLKSGFVSTSQDSTYSSLCPYLMHSTQTSTNSLLCPMYSTQTSTYSSLYPYLMYSTQTNTHSSLCPHLMYSTQTSTYSLLCPYLMYRTQTSTHSTPAQCALSPNKLCLALYPSCLMHVYP